MPYKRKKDKKKYQREWAYRKYHGLLKDEHRPVVVNKEDLIKYDKNGKLKPVG